MQTLYFSQEQVKHILQVAGDKGLIQMLYYVAISLQPVPDMEDAQLAKLMFTSIGSVKRTRLALTKAKLFERIRTKSKGVNYVAYFVGKEAVSAHTGTINKVQGTL